MMRTSILLFVGALLSSTFASDHVVLERRHDATNKKWTKTAPLNGSRVLPIRIGLKQSNIEHGHNWLMDVSDPKSARFGKHWTAEEVVDAFKPRYITSVSVFGSLRTDKCSHETIHAVHTWLNDSGIHTDRHRLSEGLGWLQFDVST